MYTIQDMIYEIEKLKGADVKIFGQSTTLADNVDNMTCDIIHILKALSDYQYDETELSGDADDIIETMIDLGWATDCIKADNSYNWGSPINHDFNFEIYNGLDNDVYVTFMVHRFGDIRGNYTEKTILHFDNEYEFIELLMDSSIKCFTLTIDGLEYACDIDCTRDWINVWCVDTDNQYELYACDEDDLIEEIKKAI